MTDGALQLAKALNDLNSRWTPHHAQQKILNALFLYLRRIVMAELGRKGGKTEIICYFLWRLAMLVPGGYYYFAPELKQAREIVWASGRVQNFGPPEYIHDLNNSDLRITLTNGSFIKIDGSDNPNAMRGIQPHGLAYDEFKDFRPEFHKAMGPNLAVFKAPLLICGTPPEQLELDHYDKLKAQAIRRGAYFNMPTWCNPHIDRQWLLEEKADLYERGDGDVWEREYAAKRVRGGANAIFPMWSRQKHVRPHADVMAEVLRDRKRLIWQVICDPGNATVFGVLFRAINPYTRVVYRLDEIYERNQAETSTSRIIPRIRAMREELFPNWEAYGISWEQIYDEAATWFATEALNSFGEVFTPTRKATKKKDEGISLQKDQMLHGLTVVSDRCSFFIKETENYIRDKNGNIPKVDDHLVDADRYGNAFASVDLTPILEPEKPDPDTQRRYHTPDDDLNALADQSELDF